MTYEPLDESLINSDVCIRCGHCCKWTTATQLTNDKGVEWLDVMIGTNPKAKMLKHNKRTIKKPSGEVMRDSTPFEIQFTCPQLATNDEGHKLCSIYKDRPTICSDYNCFESSNINKRRPQQWDKIKDIIKEVHGIDVEYKGPIPKNPGSQIKAELERIGIKEINSN
jgi:Fe-S-cluster containining protein